MNINQTERDNLYKGLGLFLEAFRPFVVSVVMRKNAADWAKEFYDSLPDYQKENWKRDLANGTAPENALDFQYFQSFAYFFKDLLKTDFGRKTHHVKNWLGEIYETRNKVAHFNRVIDEDEAAKTWIHLKTIANLLGMTELEAEIVKLKDNKTVADTRQEEAKAENSAPSVLNTTMPWFRMVTPHLDIRQGRLDESVFAANLAEVALGTGREIYTNPILFFEKTFFTSGLKSIAKTVIKGLNGQEDAENRVMSLQTGFGGGKTHTLISLFHLARLGKNAATSESVKELIESTGTPEFDGANIAVFTNTTNDAANGRMTADEIHIQTIWGELAYQLGSKAAYEIVRKNDEQLISPAGLFKQVLEKSKPALILIDELADYCVKASARKVGNSTLADQTISFMQELTEAIAGTNNCVAIITLPASPQEVGNTAQAHSILSTLESRVRRVSADTKPVADEEIYEVIRRRLFEDIGDAAQIEAVASKYMQMFQENWMEMPVHATKSEYKEKIKKSYPFHPELIDVFRIRWASNHDFQRTRGVLRLLAAIISDLWKRQNSLSGANLLIDAGDVNFANLDALSGQLKRLYGNGFDAVITADVSGSVSNAFKIDNNKTEYGKHYLAEGISSVILMNSFGTDGANRGVSIKDIKLNLLEPDSFNHNIINSALDELEAAGYYLYYAQSGQDKRYWFHTKPNINILINQAKTDIQNSDLEAEILKRINEKSRYVQPFNVLVHPTGDVPEQQKLTLVVLNPKFHADENGIAENTKKYIEQIATKKGNSERIYRNTMLFLGVTNYGLTQLIIAVKEYLACRKISEEYNSQLERDQKEELRKKIEDENKKVETALVNAYSTVLKYSVRNGFQTLTVKQFRETLDGQINNNVFETLKTEEWLLDSVGLGTLRNNNLLPTTEQSIKVKDIYEAFIRFDDKPMITNPEAVQKSLLKYCMEGAFCIAFGDEKEFTKHYLKENVPFLDVNDTNYWLVEKTLKPVPKPIPTIEPTPTPEPTTFDGKSKGNFPPSETDSIKQFKSITVSGNLPIDQFTASFNYFIAPFAMTGNKVEVQVSFKIISPENNLLTESSQQYKSAKEAAKQLGLTLEEDSS
jgi:predicted AAA+ superfamily ATPase